MTDYFRFAAPAWFALDEHGVSFGSSYTGPNGEIIDMEPERPDTDVDFVGVVHEGSTLLVIPASPDPYHVNLRLPAPWEGIEMTVPVDEPELGEVVTEAGPSRVEAVNFAKAAELFPEYFGPER